MQKGYVLWREYNAAMVFQENWKRWSGAEPPKNASEAMNVTYTYTSKEIIQRMEAKYAWLQDHAQKVMEEPRGHGVLRRSTTATNDDSHVLHWLGAKALGELAKLQKESEKVDAQVAEEEKQRKALQDDTIAGLVSSSSLSEKVKMADA